MASLLPAHIPNVFHLSTESVDDLNKKPPQGRTVKPSDLHNIASNESKSQ